MSTAARPGYRLSNLDELERRLACDFEVEESDETAGFADDGFGPAQTAHVVAADPPLSDTMATFGTLDGML